MSSLLERVKGYPGWYHIVDLGNGVLTPGKSELIPNWNLIREVRTAIDYNARGVLDVGSFDGLWAFEAEQRGAKAVVATDCYHTTIALERMLLCREALRSNVIPYYNIAPDKLFDRLDCWLGARKELFDIVQHLGVLYHLRDPLLSLSQARSCLKKGGTLLLETAITGTTHPQANYAAFNFPNRYYHDPTTWWIPSKELVGVWLNASGFRVKEGSGKVMRQSDDTERYCVVAEAVDVPEELRNGFRNPGSERFAEVR